MLRSLENLKFMKGNANGLEVQMGMQSKMIEMPFDLQTFQFEKGIQHGKDMIVLRHDAAHGALPKAAFCLSDLWKTSIGHRF